MIAAYKRFMDTSGQKGLALKAQSNFEVLDPKGINSIPSNS
jgi:hypothetical protein